jgi:TolA-binding protein
VENEKASMKKAILQFLIKHWKEILLVFLSAAIFFKMQSDMNELQKAYESAKISYETQIQGLQDIHTEELREREEALRQYQEELERIEEKYREGLREIEERTEEDIEDLEESHTDRPDEIISEIETQFGFEYVE